MNSQKHTEQIGEPSSDNITPSPPTSAQPKEARSSQNMPKKPNHSQKSLSPDRPLDELIGEPFIPFDHQASVVDPFTQEMNRDASFEQELGTMLLELVLETHAWSSARPKHESQLEVQKLEQKIMEVVEVEKEQGMWNRLPLSRTRSVSSSVFSASSSLSSVAEKTREHLNQFVSRMKKALAALTGL